MSLRVSSLVAAVTLGVLSLAPAAHAREGADLSLDQLVPNFSQRLTLRMQEEGVLDQFIPKGQLADDPWEPGIVVGQWASSAVISCFGVYFFNMMAQNDLNTIDTATVTGDALKGAQRNKLLKWGAIQFLAVPLLSGTAVWGVGNASDTYEVAYGIPLAVNYVTELALILLRIGIGIGGLQGTEAVGAVTKIGDALGFYNIVDYVLHALVVPVTVTYFSLRSRGTKSMDFGSRDVVSPAYASTLRPVYRAAVAERETRQSDVDPSTVQLSLANLSF